MIGEENKLFLISRYDRKIVRGQVESIHQFDLCQAQGYPAAEKYEDDGGPSFDQNYHTVQKNSDSKLKDLQLSLRWLAFNLIIGNNDSHSKNLSFLYDAGHCEISPLYDLISTAVYESMTSKFAFAVDGQRESLKQMSQIEIFGCSAIDYPRRTPLLGLALSYRCKNTDKYT